MGAYFKTLTLCLACGSETDLDEALRRSGVDDIAAARVVTPEPSGKITALKHDAPRASEH